MVQRYIRKTLMYLIPAAGVIGMAIPGTAGADSGQLLPPIVEFSAQNGGYVGAKIVNQNDRGVCWAENADTGAVFTIGAQFHDFGVEESVAGPGATQHKSLDVDKNGPVRVVGRCAEHLPPAGDDPSASASEVVTVEVTGASVPLFGSSG
ncbi:hypothetical protein [Nocardia sp. NPDC019395]|uniref:hypothetical protein n=1 Tax=Nocardia sp. NPDC019395 TaxID=3154686 RepID=UPI003401F3B4